MRKRFVVVVMLLGASAAALGAGVSYAGEAATRLGIEPAARHQVLAVGAENQYANVISQIGGSYVKVMAIMSNPNSDPHTFEASPAVAREIADAQLIVQNGLGYDSFMNKLEAASPARSRRVMTVQNLLGLSDSTPNPHLWYSPTTMPKVAAGIAAALSADLPAERAVFAANLLRFKASMSSWLKVVHELAFTKSHPQVATTEPVADALLAANRHHLPRFFVQ